MANAREDHGDTEFIGSIDGVLVAQATSRLDNG
jgi:hypothetical protein